MNNYTQNEFVDDCASLRNQLKNICEEEIASTLTEDDKEVVEMTVGDKISKIIQKNALLNDDIPDFNNKSLYEYYSSIIFAMRRFMENKKYLKGYEKEFLESTDNEHKEELIKNIELYKNSSRIILSTIYNASKAVVNIADGEELTRK